MQDEHVDGCNLVAALHLHALRDSCLYQNFRSPSSTQEKLSTRQFVTRTRARFKFNTGMARAELSTFLCNDVYISVQLLIYV